MEYDKKSDYLENAKKAPGISRHPNSARFHELLRKAGELHDKKQADYGAGNDPFANVRASSDWGVPAWVGAMIRLNDKVKRLQSLAGKGWLANESALDSFDDIAVYAIIARVLYEQEHGTQTKLIPGGEGYGEPLGQIRGRESGGLGGVSSVKRLRLEDYDPK